MKTKRFNREIKRQQEKSKMKEEIDRLNKEVERLDGSFKVQADANVFLVNKNEQLKAELELARQPVGVLIKRGDRFRDEAFKLKAEVVRLREILFTVGKNATGEDQIDCFSDTDVLFELAKLVGAYDKPPRYSPEAINKQD